MSSSFSYHKELFALQPP